MSLGAITPASGRVTPAREQISQIEQRPQQLNSATLLSSLAGAGSTGTRASTASTDPATGLSDSAGEVVPVQGTSDGSDVALSDVTVERRQPGSVRPDRTFVLTRGAVQ